MREYAPTSNVSLAGIIVTSLRGRLNSAVSLRFDCGKILEWIKLGLSDQGKSAVPSWIVPMTVTKPCPL
jgi:hypothetical protein